ncbi:MAG: hypothetical protein ABIL01_28925 [Pseudomonadota bacterium]
MVDSEAVKVHALQALPGKKPFALPFSRHTTKSPGWPPGLFFLECETDPSGGRLEQL